MGEYTRQAVFVKCGIFYVMRLHRFYITTPVTEKTFDIADRDLVHQWRSVFRYNVGSQVIVFDGSGTDYLCMISSLRALGATLAVIKENKTNTEKKRDVTLCVGLIKKDNFEMVVQKAVELGVSRIIPVICERSEKRKINTERLQKIIVEATEQSGRGDILSLGETMTISEVLASDLLSTNTTALHPEGVAWKEYAEHVSGEVATFLGPEGGFSDKEIDLFKAHNVHIVSLGHNILRAETASIAVASLLLV